MAKGAGKMKEISARLGGLVGVFQTIAEHHAEIAMLLRRLQSRPERRPELWPEIRRELLSHERGELRAVYPVLREYPPLEALADHHDQEAAELDTLIETLDGLDYQSSQWMLLFDQLVELVVEHAREEESAIFPRAQQVIGERLTRELTEKFIIARKHAGNAV